MPVILFPYQQFFNSSGGYQQKTDFSNQLDNLSERISAIEQALINYGIPFDEFQEMINNVFNGSDADPIVPQNQNDIKVFNMLDDVFSGNDNEIDSEDEFNQELDKIFNS